MDDDDTNIEKEGMMHMLLRLMGGVAKRKNAGDDAGDKDAVMDASKKFITTKMIETQQADSASLQAMRAEIDRIVGLTKLHPGQPLRAFFKQTSVAELKKLVEVALGNNNEQKYRQIKNMSYPNFIKVSKIMTDFCADVELSMLESSRLLVTDGFMSESTGFVSWREIHTYGQDLISDKEREYGAAAAAAAAATGMALG